MNQEIQGTHSSPAQSADWRFLLPLSQESKILLIGDNLIDVIRFLKELGIDTDVLNSGDSLTPLSTPKPARQTLDLVASPFGVSSNSSL